MSQKMNASQVTAARTVPGFSLQKVQLILLVVLLGCIMMGQCSARFSFNECPGIFGNRDAYDKVEQVCDDCYNLFRDEELSGKCRANCFLNNYFFVCLFAMERESELKDFSRRLSILNAGRW
ncbi:molt-inhibiting hormone-like [Panulirus ornatus]